ncbi:MAG: hypothetical protein ACYCS8_06715 [Acidithiobacillus sp.]
MTPLNESTIEHHAIALFQELGYAYAFGPDIGPDGDHKEREDYGETLLLERLRRCIHELISGEMRVPEADQLLEKTIG